MTVFAIQGCGSLYTDPCLVFQVASKGTIITRCFEVKHAVDDDTLSLAISGAFVFIFFIVEISRDALEGLQAFRGQGVKNNNDRWLYIAITSAGMLWIIQIGSLLVANWRIMSSGANVDNYLKNFLITVVIMQLDDVIVKLLNAHSGKLMKRKDVELVCELEAHDRPSTAGSRCFSLQDVSVLFKWVAFVGALAAIVTVVVIMIMEKQHDAVETVTNSSEFIFETQASS